MKPATVAFIILTGVMTQSAWPQAFTSGLSSPVTQADLSAAAAQNLAIMAATTPQFVGGSSAFQTKEALLANYPCSSTTVGMVANVSNVYGSYYKRMSCQTDTISSMYYWFPELPDASGTVSLTSGTYTVSSLGTPPTLFLQTTPTGTVNVLFQTPCVPGEVKHIYSPASLGLGSVNMGGLIGGGTVPLLQGSDKIVTCIGGTGWKSN